MKPKITYGCMSRSEMGVHSRWELEWRLSLPDPFDLSHAWQVCENSSYMTDMLQILQMKTLEIIMPDLLAATDVIVKRALRNHCIDTGMPVVVKWTANPVGSNLDISWAVWTASCARRGREAGESIDGQIQLISFAINSATQVRSRHVRDNAMMLEDLRLNANDIRRFIPEWPGDRFCRMKVYE